jgi:hypothetical protein
VEYSALDRISLTNDTGGVKFLGEVAVETDAAAPEWSGAPDINRPAIMR